MTKEQMICYDDEDKQKYEDLTKKKISPFHNKTYADIFVFALAYAIMKEAAPIRLKSKQPNIPISAFARKIWLINALAVSMRKTHKALFEPQQVYTLAEEYANAGIKLLYEEVFNTPGDIYKKIETWLLAYH